MEDKPKRVSRKKTSTASKLCVRCNKVLPYGDFYSNKDWSTQAYRDVWCRECASKYCYDKESLKRYCFENNRKWDDSFWDSAMKKAKYNLSTNEEYLSPKTSQEKREEMEGRAAAKAFFSMMNMIGFYSFVENVKDESIQSAPPKDGTKSRESEKVVYNKKWRGHFTEEQIEALEDIYSQYEEDFVLDNVNIRDYAKKVAKASLNADIAEDRMRRGEISASDYKEAQKIFDDLSKSSNFAACKRKPGEASGLGSLGEIIMRIEGSGKLETSGFTWEKDSVDQAIDEYRHSLIAAGLQGVL